MLSKASMVYCGAPGLKTRLSRSMMTLELVTSVTFDAPNVAMSVGEFGTVWGVQFAAVFQSPVAGLLLQIALPAREGRCAAENSSAAATRNLSLLNEVFINDSVRN